MSKLYFHILLTLLLMFSFMFIHAQAYLGTGITSSFSYKFNYADRNFSYINVDNLPMTNTWLKDEAYNFFTLFVGYNIEKSKCFHDIRITATNKGAISLLDKQDFYLDPIIIDLQAYKVLGEGPSRYIELGVNNRVIGLRYSFGTRVFKFISLSLFAQSDIVYKKRFTVNWYSDLNDNFYTLYNKYSYSLNSFKDEEPLANKVSNINAEFGINALIHLGKYFALNLEAAQNFLPAVHKGSDPARENYVYWEKNAYFTSIQIGVLTYFKSR